MSRIADKIAAALVIAGLLALALGWLLLGALMVKALTHLLHGWWAEIPPMDYLTAIAVTGVLMLLVNILTCTNFAGGRR
ncbi:hypothetical protein [Nonomuraea maritima]|uniref:hypothetical protein n=1 Tax=Nonomuraea maritima TaxID=683260 RepID=UPI00372219CF